jgi:hypothetical protein
MCARIRKEGGTFFKKNNFEVCHLFIPNIHDRTHTRKRNYAKKKGKEKEKRTIQYYIVHGPAGLFPTRPQVPPRLRPG